MFHALGPLSLLIRDKSLVGRDGFAGDPTDCKGAGAESATFFDNLGPGEGGAEKEADFRPSCDLSWFTLVHSLASFSAFSAAAAAAGEPRDVLDPVTALGGDWAGMTSTSFND